MTDTTQPEAFCWATELAMVRDPVTLTVKEAREVSDEMQRMHAENETLRIGYAAARLEIGSLRGKGWQPIETAPKDGTFLLLWEQYSTNPFIGSWLGTRWTVSHEHVDAEGGWDGANVVDALSMPVTHWMPLPAPPVAP